MRSEMERNEVGLPAPRLPQGMPLVRVIAMPADANPNGDIFGGWLLSHGSRRRQPGGTALPRAMRDGGGRRHGVSRAGLVGDEVSCYGELVKTGRTSMTVRIEAWRRHLASDEARKVTEAIFTYVALGENRRPRPLPPAAAP
jgi:acyl-CoA thioesterase YciA